jgi:hypothetical protein
VHGGRALDEEPRSLRLQQYFRRHPLCAVPGQRQCRQRIRRFAADIQRFAACREYLQRVARLQQLLREQRTGGR